MSSTLAEYWMLKEVSTLKDYGTETFRARWMDGNPAGLPPSLDRRCIVAVGPQGVSITSIEGQQQLRYPQMRRNVCDWTFETNF